MAGPGIIHIIHENDAWVVPLHAALDELRLPYRDMYLAEGAVDFTSAPPQGVYYNRMSASSHTRDHRYAIELTDLMLLWLEQHGRRVENGRASLALERSKVAQYAALSRFGIPTPATRAAVGRNALLEAARGMGAPFVVKPNRGGKGLGVNLFRTLETFESALEAGMIPDPVDGVTLVQQYIEAAAPTITRMEFIGGEFFYAVRVDTSQGFELCPADVCAPDAAVCEPGSAVRPRFEVIEDFSHPLIGSCTAFLSAVDATIAGIEFIEARDGMPYVYDVNFNTNYNPEAEAAAGKYGMKAIARYLGEQLRALGAVPSVSSEQIAAVKARA
jgi:glutathione synthase/RimK-type ligase-like ATP-grasp enzyme